MEAELVSFMTAAYGQHKETHTEASWPEFLSQFSYMLNHHLLRYAAEAADVRHVRGAYYDASESVAQLLEVEKRLRERAAREAEERRRGDERQPEDPGEPLRQTRGGILLPGHIEYRGSKQLKH